MVDYAENVSEFPDGGAISGRLEDFFERLFVKITVVVG